MSSSWYGKTRPEYWDPSARIVIVLVAVVYLLHELTLIRTRRRVEESELAVARIWQQIEECLATMSTDDDDIEL